MDQLAPITQPSAFFMVVIAAGLTPGPTNLLLLMSGLRFGLRRTLPLVSAAGAGISLTFIVSGLGLASAAQIAEQAAPVLRLLAAGYLVYLAWKIIRAPIRPDADRACEIRPVDMFLVTLVNPKAWAMTIAVQVTHLPPAHGVSDTLFAMAVFMAVTLPCLAAWPLFGHQLRPLLDRPRIARGVSLSMGGLILLAVAMTLVNGIA